MAPRGRPKKKESFEALEEAVLKEYLDHEETDEVMEDELEEQTEQGMEAQEDLNPNGPYPEHEEKKDILRHIQTEILDGRHKFKTANLVWEELGKPNFSVRFWINLGNSSQELFDMEIVKTYCIMKAGVTSDTSLSRDGYLNDLAVTSRKVKARQESTELKKFLESRGKVPQ